jgi:hypothetical protein
VIGELFLSFSFSFFFLESDILPDAENGQKEGHEECPQRGNVVCERPEGVDGNSSDACAEGIGWHRKEAFARERRAGTRAKRFESGIG